MINFNDLKEIIPMIIIAASALISLLITVFSKKPGTPVYVFSMLAVLAALVITGLNVNKDVMIIGEMMRISTYANAFCMIALLSIFITILASKDYLEKLQINFGEYYSILLFALLGMMIMIYSSDMITVFIGLETMSVCFYVLTGLLRKRAKSNESAMKYFLLGAFMTGFLLYGMSLLYGVTGSTNIVKLLTTYTAIRTPMFLTGLALFMIGFFFKIGIFPFQMWIPDVYEGAPTIVTGMMSTAGKIAAVGTLAPILITLNLVEYKILFSVLATLTMLYGNIVALSQSNLKRLLAFSSIASAGYILVGISSMDDFSIKAIVFYLLAYVFMQLGAFIVISVFETSSSDNKDFRNVTFDEYKGLAKRSPMLALSLTVFLLSLAGIPPLAGFWGKYYIFYAAIKADLIWLSVIAILLSVLSVYYYLKVIVYMWFKEPEGETSGDVIKVRTMSYAAIMLSLFGTLLFGLYPDLIFTFFKFLIK
ncbi:MAG: NADH-quinone oxidoreductase subunit N [Ignavibacteria bacterium]